MANDLESFIDTLEAQLIRHEGQRLKPYTDSIGKLTIGIGRNLTDNGISESEALMLLENDMLQVINDLDKALPWWKTLSEPRRLVLADMCFNLGIGKLLQFRLTLNAIREQRYNDASDAMLDSRWAQQVGARAHELAQMMRTDEYRA